MIRTSGLMFGAGAARAERAPTLAALALAAMLAAPAAAGAAEAELPPREPFQFATEEPWVEGELSVTARLVVPADRRLVIETVTASHTTGIGQHLTATFVSTSVGGVRAVHHLAVPRSGTSQRTLNAYSGAARVRLYADPGTVVEVGAARNDVTCPFPCGAMRMTVSGYRIPLDSPGIAP